MDEKRMATAKVIGASVGEALTTMALDTYNEMQRYPDKYNKESIKRFDVLKSIFRRHYKETPDRWVLDPETQTPHRMLMDGTWEMHWKRVMRDKKTTDLSAEVENLLYVISNYLDGRRAQGFLSKIKKGDVEEQFFGEIMLWAINILDGAVDETLSEKIDTQRRYLHEVLMDVDVFPKALMNDKSASRAVILKLYDMLGNTVLEVKKIQSQRFALNKFQDICKEGDFLLKHILRGFSYFSSDLRDMVEFTEQSLTDVMERSDTRYNALFSLFIQKLFGEKVLELYEPYGDNAVLFSPEKFRTLMCDDSKKLGITVSMTEEMLKNIPDIFIAAYHMSISMKLIKQAAVTLSEEGTVHLFCNTEGREYFEFLLQDFKSEVAYLMEKMSAFSDDCIQYVQKQVVATGENPSKNSNLGQYQRFDEVFKDIASNNQALQSHLFDTTEQIRRFSGKTPEESKQQKDSLYRMLRVRMRRKNMGALADKLESTYRANIAPSSHEKMLHEHEHKHEDVAHEAVPAETLHAANMVQENRGRAYRKLVAKQKNLISEKIDDAIKKMEKYCNPLFIVKIFRNEKKKKLGDDFLCLLRDAHKKSSSTLYDELHAFVQSAEKNILEFASEDFYLLARGLQDVLLEKTHRHLIFDELRSSANVECELREKTREAKVLADEVDHLKKVEVGHKEKISALQKTNAMHEQKIKQLTSENEQYLDEIKKQNQKIDLQGQRIIAQGNAITNLENSIPDIVKKICLDMGIMMPTNANSATS